LVAFLVPLARVDSSPLPLAAENTMKLLHRFPLALGVLGMVSTTAFAQGARNASSPSPTPSPVASHADDGKRAMTVADYAKWRTIRDAAISDDGTWASYVYEQRRVDDSLFVKNLSTGADQKIPRASRSRFSDDSKWIAYFVAEPNRPNDD